MMPSEIRVAPVFDDHRPAVGGWVAAVGNLVAAVGGWVAAVGGWEGLGYGKRSSPHCS